MIWAENTKSSRVAMHTSFGSFATTLSSEGGDSKVEKTQRRRGGRGGGIDWLLLHGIVLWIIWFVFGLAMIGLTRWWVHVPDKPIDTAKLQDIHAIAGWAITVATLFGAGIQVSRNWSKISS